jgi:hypothetical protein
VVAIEVVAVEAIVVVEDELLSVEEYSWVESVTIVVVAVESELLLSEE